MRRNSSVTVRLVAAPALPRVIGEGGAEETVGQLQVRRGRDDAGMMRQIIVRLDGEVVARLSQGEQATLSVLPGERVLRASMDWCTSLEVTLSVEPGGESSVLGGPAVEFDVAQLRYSGAGAHRHLGVPALSAGLRHGQNGTYPPSP